MPQSDSTNPYQPPEQVSGSAPGSVMAPQQARAQRAIHWAIFWLLPAALTNWGCLQFLDFSDSNLGAGSFYGPHLEIQILFGGTNLVTTLLLFAAAWFWFLPVAEKLSAACWHFTGRRVELSKWQTALWKSLEMLFYVSPLGALLWYFWIFIFFFIRLRIGLFTDICHFGACLLAILVGLAIVLNWLALLLNQARRV